MARIIPVQAADLLRDDAIEFGNELLLVIGLDPVNDDGLIPLVTEDVTGTQFVDYVDPQRVFTVVR